jgi:hypothetical protein
MFLVVRDTEERGIPLETVFHRYVNFGKKAFDGKSLLYAILMVSTVYPNIYT